VTEKEKRLSPRMRALIPGRQRSRIIAKLLEEELKRREKKLFECAKEVERGEKLAREMQDWEVTVGDGIEPEPR